MLKSNNFPRIGNGALSGCELSSIVKLKWFAHTKSSLILAYLELQQ